MAYLSAAKARHGGRLVNKLKKKNHGRQPDYAMFAANKRRSRHYIRIKVKCNGCGHKYSFEHVESRNLHNVKCEKCKAQRIEQDFSDLVNKYRHD